MFFKKRKALTLMIVMLILMLAFVGCSKPQDADLSDTNEVVEDTPDEIANKTLLLSTTTSTENSGLLDFLHPIFTEDTGIEVKTVAVGTGQALQMGVDGEADVLLVHAKASEEEFIANGHGIERFEVMYNDFILIGPGDDPAGILAAAPDNILDAFKALHDNKSTFISRGDDSGTHKIELQFWKELDLETEGDWYIDAGQGMGAVIQMTDEMQGYTLTDRATYLSMKNDLNLVVITESDTNLFNQYGVIAVNPDKSDKINNQAAEAYIQWLISDKGQELISEFGKEEFGQSLFIPNAK